MKKLYVSVILTVCMSSAVHADEDDSDSKELVINKCVQEVQEYRLLNFLQAIVSALLPPEGLNDNVEAASQQREDEMRRRYYSGIFRSEGLL